MVPEQIVLDADLYYSVEALLKDMVLDDRHLAYDVTKRVGPGGDFLADEHTLRWMYDEYNYSSVVNHDGKHGKSMLDRAYDEVQTLLEQDTSIASKKSKMTSETLLDDYTSKL